METIGRYQVVRQLGHGGMGDVFLARDPSLERDVALKLLHRDSTQTGLRDEAKALASLNHAGIVTIYEIGEHDGRDFIAMEYLPGRSLRELLLERDVVPRRAELLAICAKVAAAVGAAHRAGILHRDVKPENIVVDDADHVKVVDFGIARRLEHESQRTKRAITAQDVVEALRRTIPPELGTATLVSAGTQTVFGTPAYMAPEVLLGAPSTQASDIYSLGVVVYECLAGRRPYDAGTLLEVMAQMIEGPPPRLADPCGALVESMLASDPAQRPTLEHIAQRLAAAATAAAPAVSVASVASAPVVARPLARAPVVAAAAAPPARHWPVIVGATAAVLAIAVGVWWLTRATTSASVPAVAPVALGQVTATIAVAPLRIDTPSYGAEPPNVEIEADTLARRFEQVDGAHFKGIGVPEQAEARASAKAAGATYLVTGSAKEDGDQLRGDFTLTSVDSGAQLAIAHVAQPAHRSAQLFDQVVAELAHAIAPAATLELAANRPRAEQFYRQGEAVFRTGHFTDARPYLEQAVDADPSFFDAWYALSLVVSWMNASEDVLLDVTQHAIATAAPGAKQDLMRGVALFIAADYAGARALLEPLDGPNATGLDRDARVQILYYLGETNWHDGRHDIAFGYFKRALELDPRFRPATVHAMQYTLARRDPDSARYVGLAGENSGWLDFSQGHYAALADAHDPGFKLPALFVLDRPLTPDVAAHVQGDGLDASSYRIAIAAGAGDLPTARREFAAAWTRILALRDAKQIDGGTMYGLESLGEIVLSAAMIDETKLVVALLAAQSTVRPVRGYQRLSILAAPVVGDPTLIVTTPKLSSRNQQLAAASAAELAGDRAQAVTLLTAIVADPTALWDYPERAALARNLLALHRTRELVALCRDTLRPAVFRAAFLVVRHTCADVRGVTAPR